MTPTELELAEAKVFLNALRNFNLSDKGEHNVDVAIQGLIDRGKDKDVKLAAETVRKAYEDGYNDAYNKFSSMTCEWCSGSCKIEYCNNRLKCYKYGLLVTPDMRCSGWYQDTKDRRYVKGE